ncbi:hypothetical protein F5887DRAFT_919047 [Amanita rubescens]|nr:hypothetical protein F5887DRAFT_919047 [Amanita rubescens]
MYKWYSDHQRCSTLDMHIKSHPEQSTLTDTCNAHLNSNGEHLWTTTHSTCATHMQHLTMTVPHALEARGSHQRAGGGNGMWSTLRMGGIDGLLDVGGDGENGKGGVTHHTPVVVGVSPSSLRHFLVFLINLSNVVEMVHFRPLLFLGGKTGAVFCCDRLWAIVDDRGISESAIPHSHEFCMESVWTPEFAWNLYGFLLDSLCLFGRGLSILKPPPECLGEGKELTRYSGSGRWRIKVPENERLTGEGWVMSIKKAYKLQEIRRHGEAASVDPDAVEAEREAVSKILEKYPPADQWNFDETSLFAFAPPDCGLATRQMSRKKKNKFWLTLGFACNANGIRWVKAFDIKMQEVVVFKGLVWSGFLPKIERTVTVTGHSPMAQPQNQDWNCCNWSQSVWSTLVSLNGPVMDWFSY